mgnify:CR=1 FL=1
MHIRFADPGDAAACLAVYAQYIDTSITFETVLPSEAEFSGRIRSYGAVYPWLIAEEDGHVLAYAYAQWEAMFVSLIWQNGGDYRDEAGRGLGTKLYTVLLALLQKQGVRTAYGVVTMPNDASSALHQKLGFRTLGTYRNTGYKNGRWRDVVWFEKPIGSFTDEPQPLVPITLLPDAAAILAAANT